MADCLRLALVVLVASPFLAVKKQGEYGSANSVRPVIVWQGFHFQWLRRELGFETPHRLGSVASYIYNVSSACSMVDRNCSVFGTYQVQFTPGVSGDYAYPKAYYQFAAAVDPSLIELTSGNATFSFQDNSTTEPVLHASTSHRVNITLPLSELSENQLLLQGFHIDMKCLPTSNHPCNSNAIWPYYFNISLAGKCSTLSEKKSVVCPLYFGLGRGWTPSHGGGKPYNYEMAYNVTVLYTRVQYSASAGDVTMLLQRLTKKGNIYHPPLTGHQLLLSDISTARNSALVGLAEISWDLTQTNGYLDRGRYLEELAFFVEQSPARQGEEIGYTWTLGYRDPSLTTYPSDAHYSLGVAALIAPTGKLKVSATSSVNGSVCMDNEDIFTFHCSKLGLKSTTRDTVDISGTFHEQFQ